VLQTKKTMSSIFKPDSDTPVRSLYWVQVAVYINTLTYTMCAYINNSNFTITSYLLTYNCVEQIQHVTPHQKRLLIIFSTIITIKPI